MKKRRFTKFFSSMLAFVMVLSLLAPFSVSANTVQDKPFKKSEQTESTMQLKAAVAEQLNVLDGGSKLHKDLQGLSGNEQVDVIIHLSEKSVALEQGIKNLAGKTMTTSQMAKVKKNVNAQQAVVNKEMMSKNISFEKGFSFDTVLNGFAAKVKAGDLEKLLDVEGVTLVEPDATVYAMQDSKATVSSELIKDDELEAAMNTSISFLGIEELWKEGYEGQGIKVAVLDTGIDAQHPEFQGIYKGGKNFVPHEGSDYARPRADDDASETSPKDRPANRPEFNDRGSAFYTSHGTHVAGTIAAIGANEYGIKGIAPKVDLYAYRVLGAYGSGATSGIIAAIDAAVEEDIDVINLSLGGGSNTETDGGSFAINNAMMAGTISVIATGNSGPNRGTMGTPSTARLGIAVGNTTNPETMHNGKASITVGDYTLSKQLNLMGTTFGEKLATQLDGEFEVVAVPGNGAATDYNDIDVKGKVALISRGEIAFVDKIAAAKENGAIAAIIHNFAGGTNAPAESGTFLGDSFEFIPTFDMSVTDGDAIRAALQKGAGTITFGEFASSATTGDEVNDSSSRGPSTPNFDIKPDVSAPGTNIMSTIPQYGADFPDAIYDQSYDRKTGTSMATPHIAAIAALVKQANPTWNAFDVKVALSNTAKILDTTKYDVMSQGAGRVDAHAAAHAGVLAYGVDTANNDGAVVENLKGTVTFGPQSLEEDLTVTKQILVKDLKGEGGDYDVSVDVTKAFGDAELTIDKPSFTLAGEQMLNVTLTASKNLDVKPGDEILGYIHIKGGDKDLSLPFAADFGGAAAAALKDFAITETDLSFNGDGVKDSAVLSFTLTGDVTTNYIELWDIMNPTGGKFADGYIGYLHAGQALAAGSYNLNVAGKYYPWSGEPQNTIPDGLYTIDFLGMTVSGNPEAVSDYVGPVIVKSTAGTIEGTISGKQATGKIIDKYIDYQAELVNYGLGFDVNTKLKATYEIISGEQVKSTGDVKLEQDGSFSFETGTLAKDDQLKVKYIDAAGNAAEQILTKVTLSVDQETVSIEKGKTASVKVTETTTIEDKSTEVDVTSEAKYAVEDAAIVSVEKGLITAKAKGETTITITHGDKTVIVNVTVTDPVEAPKAEVTLSVDQKTVSIEKGKTASVKVTETTTIEDKSTEADVTADATYAVEDAAIVSVEKGVITAKAKGETTITITHGDNTVSVNVTVTDPVEAPKAEVTLSVDQKTVSIEKGKTASVKVTETTTIEDKSTEADVTADATYAVEDAAIVSVEKGVITAKAKGETTITITHGDNTVNVNVTVTSPVIVDPGPVNPPVEPKPEDPKPITPPVFSDITNVFAKDEINKLAAKGIIQGKSDTNFAPNAQITRAEFAVLLARSLELPTKKYEGTFSDVNTSKKWAYAAVEAAAKAGIVNGTADGKFNPDAPIKREEIAAMVIRALEYQDKSKLENLDTPANFKDHGHIGAFAIDSVYKATALGVIKGNEGNFNPKNNATRAEAAVMLYRALDTLELLK